MESYVLSIDIGTSSCKAVVFSETGRMLAMEREAYPLLFPKDGWVEQDPDAIFQGVCRAVEKLSAYDFNMALVSAVSFSAQIAAQCLVDENGHPMTNLISWMDSRAKKEAEDFIKEFSAERTEELTGVDMVVTPAYSIAKLRWLYNHKRDDLQKADRFVQIKDYVIHCLTGEWVSDFTSLKGLVHQESGEPTPEILRFTGTPAEILPRARRPYEIAGYLVGDIPGFEQISVGTPVVTGWNDMNAAFLGMGALSSGCVGLDLTGTSEHLGCVRKHEEVSREIYEGINRVPFLYDREVFYGVTSSGGQAVEWFVKDFIGAPNVNDYFCKLFVEREEFFWLKNEELIFLPYLEGERNPWNNPDACGVFFGLRRSHHQEDLAAAVLEGVCFALRAIYDKFPEKPEYIVVAGGASFNAIWNQMKADVLDTPFRRLDISEAGCAGAAILAFAALRPDKTLKEIASGMTHFDEVYVPDEKRHFYYENKYRKFLALYQDLEVSFMHKERK